MLSHITIIISYQYYSHYYHYHHYHYYYSQLFENSRRAAGRAADRRGTVTCICLVCLCVIIYLYIHISLSLSLSLYIYIYILLWCSFFFVLLLFAASVMMYPSSLIPSGPSDEEGTVEEIRVDMVQLFNPKNIRASLWKKCSFKGFVKTTPEKRTFIPQPRFSCFSLIICDN